MRSRREVEFFFFMEITIKGNFCNGLKDCLKDPMPNSNGSATLEEYIDFVLLLSGSSFAVGIAYEEPCNPTVPTSPELFPHPNRHVWSCSRHACYS